MSQHLVLMRYDDWSSHQNNESKSNNQHVRQEDSIYQTKCNIESLEVTSNLN